MKAHTLIQLAAIVFITVTCAAATKPNIVFILVDDMGWTGLSTRMDKKLQDSASDFYQTPRIDALAAQSMVFSQAYSPGPMCTPSRAGILTGKTPAQLHMTTPGGGRPQSHQRLAAPAFVRELPTSETTIAEALKQQGYATAHFGKWHLGRGHPGQHGFDQHDGSTGNDGYGAANASDPKDVFGITERGCKFIDEHFKLGEPFYLQLSHYAVHSPTESLKSSSDRFSKLPSGERHSKIDYAAMTYDLDTSVGRLLQKIDELELTDITYVVLMSDNGAPGNPRRPANAPLAAGKGSLYEGGIRVPLIIRGPGISNGHSAVAVTGCDLLPTFCEWAGTSVEGIDGSSLVPLLSASPSELKRQNSSLLFHYPHYGMGPLQKPQSAIIERNWKLIRDLETGSNQLFDLSSDISEKHDLSEKMPEKAQQMSKQLDERLKQAGAQMPTQNPTFDPASSAPIRRPRGRRR